MELPEWLKSREQSMTLGEAVSIAEMMDWDDDKCAPVFLCKPEEAYLAFKKLAEHARGVPPVRKLTHDPEEVWGNYNIAANTKPLYEKYVKADIEFTETFYNEKTYNFEKSDVYKHAMEAMKTMPPVWPKLKKPND